VVSRCDVLAVGAHPDDVELGCGGTIARLAGAGRTVGLVDLTAGELGTRGDVETRHREAEAAAAALGAAWRRCLGLPDGQLAADDPDQLASLVGILREAAPRAVLGPDAGDPHPDHAATAGLLGRATFLAGVAKFRPDLGPPARPLLTLAYPGPRQLVTPTIVVDVSEAYARKRAALAAHGSQFDPTGGSATHLASGHFLAAIDGRDRAAGNTVGVEHGEAFTAIGPLPAAELARLLGVHESDPGPRTSGHGGEGKGR
jgi:bacillithiol biosynthesis deacetylase BshB1